MQCHTSRTDPFTNSVSTDKVCDKVCGKGRLKWDLSGFKTRVKPALAAKPPGCLKHPGGTLSLCASLCPFVAVGVPNQAQHRQHPCSDKSPYRNAFHIYHHLSWLYCSYFLIGHELTEVGY